MGFYPTIHNPTMRGSCINYENMLTLYRCNSKYLKGKYKHGEKKQAGPKKLHFLQIAVFSSNIF